MKKLLILLLLVSFGFSQWIARWYGKNIIVAADSIVFSCDVLPDDDGLRDLGGPGVWFDSSFIAHGWFKYLRVDSGGYLKLDSAELTNLIVKDTIFTDFIAPDDSTEVYVAGDLTVSGETNLGDAVTDTITCTGVVEFAGNKWFGYDASGEDTTDMAFGATTTTFDSENTFYIRIAGGNKMNFTTTSTTIQTKLIATSLVKLGSAVTDTVEVVGVLDLRGGFTHGTITASADNVNADNITILNVDTNGGNVTIGGFINGVAGQILHIYNSDANNVVIEDDEGTGNQDIKTSTAADVTITAEGGTTLIYDGTDSIWRMIGLAQ